MDDGAATENHHHTPNPDYTPFETFTLVRPRSDGHGRPGEVAVTGTASHAG